jgi:hypothetical protein
MYSTSIYQECSSDKNHLSTENRREGDETWDLPPGAHALFCFKQIKLLSATRGQIELGAIKAGDTRGPGKGRDTYDISKDVQPRLRS